MENKYRNPLWDIFEYGLLRPAGAKIYSAFNQLPDAPWMHGAAKTRLMNDNKYNLYLNQFRNAEIDRRIRALKENTQMLLNRNN